MSELGEPSICRDENCPRHDLHLAHQVQAQGEDFSERTKTEAKERLGTVRWVKIPEGIEPPEGAEIRTNRDGSRSYMIYKPPWRKFSGRALDHAIARAVSKTYPKLVSTIVKEVTDDYGTCELRSVQRHLSKLVERGQVIRVDLGRRLFAYVRPGASIAGDVDLMREQLDNFDQPIAVEG